jgi:hypothetical protein
MNSALFARHALSKGRDSAAAPNRNDDAPRQEARGVQIVGLRDAQILRSATGRYHCWCWIFRLLRA